MHQQRSVTFRLSCLAHGCSSTDASFLLTSMRGPARPARRRTAQGDRCDQDQSGQAHHEHVMPQREERRCQARCPHSQADCHGQHVVHHQARGRHQVDRGSQILLAHRCHGSVSPRCASKTTAHAATSSGSGTTPRPLYAWLANGPWRTSSDQPLSSSHIAGASGGTCSAKAVSSG